MTSLHRRVTIGLLIASATLALPDIAAAHVDPDPTEAPAGSQQSVGFTVTHGCDGSPTVQLDMRLPDGVSGVVPEPPDGWEGALAGDVVTFTGGPLADDVELTFRVSMTLPSTPDVTIYFPFVQRCGVGEIRWIDIPEDGSDTELDEPAPAMLLTAPLPGTTATTALTPPSTNPPAETLAPETSAAAAATTVPSTSHSSTTTVEVTTTTAAAQPDDDSSGAGSAVFFGVLAVVVAGGAVLAWRTSRRR